MSNCKERFIYHKWITRLLIGIILTVWILLSIAIVLNGSLFGAAAAPGLVITAIALLFATIITANNLYYWDDIKICSTINKTCGDLFNLIITDYRRLTRVIISAAVSLSIAVASGWVYIPILGSISILAGMILVTMALGMLIQLLRNFNGLMDCLKL